MAYRFKIGEEFGDGLRRIGAEQIERAISQLESAPTGTAVHETRKCMKRIRALLRLVRAGIGEGAYKRENARFGDIGRMLSTSRDQAVIRATADRLEADHPEQAAALRALKRAVPDPGRSGNGTAAKRLAGRAIRELRDADRAWRELLLRGDGADSIASGVARGLLELRDAVAGSEGGEDEAVHDWRKAVQRHWRHMLLVREGWPLHFEARAAEAKQVSEILGLAQDLTLVIARATEPGGKGLSEAQVKIIGDLAERRRDALRQMASGHCLRLVAEGPEGHARRTMSYWNAAAGIAAVADHAAPLASVVAIAAADDGIGRGKVRRSTGSRTVRYTTSRPRAHGGRKQPRRRKDT